MKGEGDVGISGAMLVIDKPAGIREDGRIGPRAISERIEPNRFNPLG